MYLVFLPGFQFVTRVYRKRWSGEHPSFQEMKEPIGIMYMPVKNLILFNSAKFGDEWTAPRLDICHTRHQLFTEPKTSSCGSDVICNVLPSLVQYLTSDTLVISPYSKAVHACIFIIVVCTVFMPRRVRRRERSVRIFRSIFCIVGRRRRRELRTRRIVRWGSRTCIR